MKTTEVNKGLIDSHCECMFAGEMVTGVIEKVNITQSTVEVSVHLDSLQRWHNETFTHDWLIGKREDESGSLVYLKLLPHEPPYETLVVTFKEPIKSLNHFFDDHQTWGVSSLKEWIDQYETTRFTQTGECEAVITSEINMGCVREWLEANLPIDNYHLS